MTLKLVDKIFLAIFLIYQAGRYLFFSALNALFPSVFKAYPLNPSVKSNAVLITGCSSGIGRHAALHLALKGYTVFAGVRKPEDGKSLITRFTGKTVAKGGHGIIVPVIIDVANDKSVKEGSDFVSKYLQGNGCRLTAIVNNAGIGYAGVVETYPESKIQELWNVNVLGTIRVIKAFLPLLRERGKGARIINIGSVGGVTATFSNGIYCATKFSVQAISQALKAEVAPQGISVSVVNPGAIKTKIFGKVEQQKKDSIAKQGINPIQDDYYKEFDLYEKQFLDVCEVTAVDPIYTSVIIEHAIAAKYPQATYFAGADALLLGFLAQTLPTPLSDAVANFILTKGPKFILKSKKLE